MPPISESAVVTVGNRKVSLSNLDKILFPKARFTKGQVIDYYTRIAPALLPHLKNRALTLKRYPDGVEGPFFYEKHCPSHRPEWIKTAPLWSETNHRNISYCVINDLPSLVWAANLADLELHTSLALYPKPDRPTFMVFDLDPGPGAGLAECAEVALWLRDALDAIRLRSFPKTSGSKGMQIYVPLNTPVTFEETKSFSRELAEGLADRRPEKITSKMSKPLRNGKVFIDWSQNDHHKTTVCAYSLRAKERPTVSCPISWNEVENALNSGDATGPLFDAQETLERVGKLGDLFEPVLCVKQKLPRLAGL